jgi:hypothetical protein
MENLKLPRWPYEASKVFGGGGLLDGLPGPARSSGLDFLFGGTDGQGGLTIGQVDPGALVLGRPEGNYLPATGPKNPIGPVQGYPETGRNSWRAGNDDMIVAAASNYNAANGYFPGDVDYMTPQLMKSWMMEESGSGAHRRYFETDPFQVNVPGDWVAEKGRIAGLTKGQKMTPQASAEAALRWARYKSSWPGLEFSSPLARRAHYGTYEALLNYNGSPRKIDYANDILNRAWASYGDWQK